MGVVFLLALSPRWTPFIEDTAPTGVIVRQPRETDSDTRRGVQSPAANHQHRPSCLPPWSLRRDGQKRLEGLTIATLQQNTAQATMLIMARWCSVPSLQRGKVQSQDRGISRVLLRGPGVALSGNAERFTTVGPIKIPCPAPGDFLNFAGPH